jgi:hypothetical protein
MQPNLTPDDYATLAALLRDTIAADRFPLSPRVRSLKAILDKLEPPAPKREPLPPMKPPGEPSMVVARMRGTKRRRGKGKSPARVAPDGASRSGRLPLP